MTIDIDINSGKVDFAVFAIMVVHWLEKK